MFSGRPIEERIVIDKLAVITFDEPVNEIEFRKYVIKNWNNLTLGLNDGSTILFVAGVHGEDTGKLGPAESIKTLTNQVRINLNYFSSPNISQTNFFNIVVFAKSS